MNVLKLVLPGGTLPHRMLLGEDCDCIGSGGGEWTGCCGAVR